MKNHPGNRILAWGLTVVSLLVFSVGSRLAAEPLRLDLGGGVGIDLVLVRAGSFTQGSPDDEAGRGADENSRFVTITRDYYMSRSSVTRGQWERFAAETGHRTEAETGTSGGYGWDGAALVQNKQFTWRNPGFPQNNDHPVCLVTFPDAQAFCSWVERKTKRMTRLPTEAQWEFACRAGTTTPWHTGASADEVAWHKGNSGNATHPVDSKQANPWGFHIGGNISEWCLDWYAPYQAGSVTDPLQDNPNLSDKPRRVLRGGSWLRDAKNTRSAARYRADPRSRNADIGFRIVCATGVVAQPQKPQSSMPNAELEPGAVPPVPNPGTHDAGHVEPDPAVPMVSRHSVGGVVGNLFASLLCLMVPVVLVILIVRFMVGKGRQNTSNPFVAPPPQPNPPLRSSNLRIVNDGFWFHGDWPVGAPLSVRYVTGGVPSAINLLYQPGAQGQFVFTGVAPDSASVVSHGQDVLSEPVVDSPVRPYRETSQPTSPRPPIFPSAY